GKTTSVSAWLNARPELDAVWITVTSRDWADVRRALEAQIGMDSGSESAELAMWWARLVEHLGEDGRHLVVVLDGVDRLVGESRFDAIFAALEQLPRLTVVFSSRTALVDPATGMSSRIELVTTALSWD